jgi:hypothetical protein
MRQEVHTHRSIPIQVHEHTAPSMHAIEKLQRLLPLPALVTRADGRVGDGGADTARPDSLNRTAIQQTR